MKRMREDAQSLSEKARIWALTEAEILSLAADLSEAQCADPEELEPRLFDDLPVKTQAAEVRVINRIRAKGYPLEIVRKVATAVRPKTVEDNLARYRDEIGLST